MASYDKAEQKNVQNNLIDYIDIQIINPQLQRSKAVTGRALEVEPMLALN